MRGKELLGRSVQGSWIRLRMYVHIYEGIAFRIV